MDRKRLLDTMWLYSLPALQQEFEEWVVPYSTMTDDQLKAQAALLSLDDHVRWQWCVAFWEPSSPTDKLDELNFLLGSL